MMTQAEIAKEFGISQSTVSRALKDPESSHFSDELRGRILDFCRQKTPETLRGNRMWDAAFTAWNGYLKSPFYLQLFSGAQSKASELDYTLVFEDVNSFPRHAKLRKYDGFIDARSNCTSSLQSINLPMVFLNTASADGSADSVMPNNNIMMRLALSHLKENGFRKIAYLDFVSTHKDFWPLHSKERRTAFLNQCEQLGLSDRYRIEYAINLHEEETAIPKILDSLIGTDRMPDSFLCADYYTPFLITALNDRGLSVPADISIVGFDNLDPFGKAGFITTIDFNLFEMGRTAMSLLHDRIGNPGKPHIRVDVEPRLIRGQSVRELESATIHRLPRKLYVNNIPTTENV